MPQEQRAWFPDVLGDLDASARGNLLAAGYRVQLEENEQLPAVQESIIRVEFGFVKLAVFSGERNLVVSLYGPDDTILAPLYHAWAPPIYYVEAQEASTLRVIPQSAVLDACASSATLTRSLLRQFSYDGWMMMDRMHSLAFHNLTRRVAQVLVNLSAMMGRIERDKVRLRLRLTQEELAELAGARRETLSTVLQDLREDNILDVRYARIDIRDYERLKALAGTEPLPFLQRGIIDPGDEG